MKKALIIVAISICAFTSSNKPSLTQSQWEAIMDAQLAYTLSKAYSSPDTTAKMNTLLSSLQHVQGMSQQQLEDKMEEFYGPDWKNAGGPLHTVCQIICGITYSVCFDTIIPGWDIFKCETRYRDCMRMCGMLPPGL